MLERTITFVVLGFFVFVADFGSWWQGEGLIGWYSNFILWIALIAACFIATKHSSKDQ